MILGLLLLLSLPAHAQRVEHGVDTWKPVHFEIALTLNANLTEIASARAILTVEALQDNLVSLDLDFGDLAIDSMTVDGRACRFSRRPGHLIAALDPPAQRGGRLEVAVAYHGRPKDGLLMSKGRKRPFAVADNWPDRAHNWIPCLDHPSAKATVRYTITAPERDVVVANGALEYSSAAARGTRLWVYSEKVPIPAYCMVVSIGEDVVITATQTAVTSLTYYVPPSFRDYANRGFSAAAPALDYYQSTVAPFPFEKLALILGDSAFEGMEFPSAIVYPRAIFELSKKPEPMSRRFGVPSRIEIAVAHEIAHQWFGDDVTESTWADLWLSEGFATYFTGLFIEKYEGEQAFRAYMSDAAGLAFDFEKHVRLPLHDTLTLNLQQLLNNNVYQKGAWVLHMLRRRLGDDAFFRGVRDYYDSHRGATANSEDLRDSLEKSSGRDLKDFFGRWVYGTGHPVYSLSSSWEEKAPGHGELTLKLNQVQTGEPFLDPVDVEIVTLSGKSRVTMRPAGKAATAVVSLDDKPLTVRLDPDGALLGETAP
jgi:aminopeptidase N